MKKTAFVMVLPVLMWLLTSCGGGSVYERLEGRWVLSQQGTHIGVNINDDGTGSIDISAENERGHNKLLVKEDVTFTEDGEILYFKMDDIDGDGGHFIVKDDRLYSAEGDPFRKTK